MVHPFLPMPVYGAIWYQGKTYMYIMLNLCLRRRFATVAQSILTIMLLGEANTYNHELYGCAIQQMVEDWRASWFANTPTMGEQFPFGEVQVTAQNTTAAVCGMEFHF